mgnify:CR=1 FL=1
MILKKVIFIILLSTNIYSCAEYKMISKKNEKNYFFSSGFALIYHENLYKDKILNKKINQNKIIVLHNTLKKNTPIKVINPENQISIVTKIHAKIDFPSLFNAVISKRIASILKLEKENPYIEILEIKKNKTFIAKEGSIFDEERNVAEKVPVSEIEIADLTTGKTINTTKFNTDKNFIIVIADFYYKNSAELLKKELILKTKFKSFYVKEINNKKYMLLVGPFKNFNALKNTYISLNKLGFENLNIIDN